MNSLREEVRRELTAQDGDAVLALEDPGELTELLGDARVVVPPGSEAEGRVALGVPDAAVVGERAVLQKPLTVGGERLEPGVYARSSVLDPLRESLERLWSRAVEPGDLPGEEWAARRAAAEAYVIWRLPRPGGSALPGGLEELVEAFRSGYGGSKESTELEKGFWLSVDPDGLKEYVDGLDPGSLRVDRFSVLLSPESLMDGAETPAVPDPLRESLEEWARGADPGSAGPLAGRISRPSVERGMALVASSLLADSPSWSDALFEAGAASVLEALGDSRGDPGG